MSRRKGGAVQPPAADAGPGPQADGLYEIRTLLKKRRGKGGRTEYLVAWKGYDASENTWEPVTGLPGWVVQEFEDRQKCGAKSTAGATKRKRPLEAVRGVVRPPKKSKYTCTLPTSGYPLRGCPANMRACRTILNGLLSNELSAPFHEPVDPVALNLPNYFDVVKQPMDLGTVSTRLKSSRYKEVNDFLTDCRLVWSNAMTYNEDKSNIYEMARRLRDDFERRFTTAARGFINRTGGTNTAGGATMTARSLQASGASVAPSSSTMKLKPCTTEPTASSANGAASACGGRGGAGSDSGGAAQRKKSKPSKARSAGAVSASCGSQSRSAQAAIAEPPKLPAFLNPESNAPDPQEAAIRRELSALAKRHSDVSLRVAGAQGRVIKSLAGCQLRGNQHNTGILATCLKRLLDHKFSRMFHAAKCQKVLREEKAGTYSHGEEASEALPALDANEILHSLHAERYETADDLMRDTRRVWSEAMLRVGEHQLVFKLAQTLSRFFDAELRRASTNLHGVEWEQKQPSAATASASALASSAAGAGTTTLAAAAAAASSAAAASAASATAAAAQAPARGRARSSSFSQSAQAKRAHAVSLAQAAQAVAQHDAAEAAAAVSGKMNSSSPLFLGQSHDRGRLGSAPLDTPDLYDWQATPQHSPPLGPTNANAADNSPGLTFGLTSSHHPGALSLPASASAPSSAMLGSMLPPPLPPPGSIASESGIEVEDMLHSGNVPGAVDGARAAVPVPATGDGEVQQQWDVAIQPLDVV